MHDDEVLVADEVARKLITEQFPEWSDEPILRIESSGTVNTIFRIGKGFAARMPRRPEAPELMRQALEAEALAATEFMQHSPFPSPVPVALGEPGHGYPLPWSVQTWLPGTVSVDTHASTSATLARELAFLIVSLRRADTAGRTFPGGGRGGELRDHDEWVETCIRESASMFDARQLEELWSYFRALPRTSPDMMTHGDLTSPNILVDGEHLAGVLDCGGFGPSDPALDVVAAWHLLADAPRAIFRAALACDELEWERGKAWAFEQALGAVWYYAASNPVMHSMGHLTLRRIIANS